MKTKTRRNIFALVAIAILITLDQISKVWTRNYISNNPIIIWDGVLSLSFVKNTGAAWGIFRNHTEILSIFSFVFSVLFFYLYTKLPDTKRFKALRYIFIFVIAGAVGNGIDRLFWGYVTDFISFDLINFPVFNIADCYITVCMFLMVILILFYYKDEDFTFLKRKKADTEDNRADINEEHE